MLKMEADESIQPCPHCREGFEREVHERVKTSMRAIPIPAPGDALERVERLASRSSSRRTRKGSSTPVFILLFAILLLGAYIIFFDDERDDAAPATVTQTVADPDRKPIPKPTRRSTGPVNVFNTAFDNFAAAKGGSMKPTSTATSLASLKTTLAAAGAQMPAFAGSTLPLKGGLVTEHGSYKVPHMIFSDNKTTLYVMEIPLEKLKAQEKFYVIDDDMAKLEAGETIELEGATREHLAMYSTGTSVVVAVANRSRPDLLKLIGRPDTK